MARSALRAVSIRYLCPALTRISRARFTRQSEGNAPVKSEKENESFLVCAACDDKPRFEKEMPRRDFFSVPLPRIFKEKEQSLELNGYQRRSPNLSYRECAIGAIVIMIEGSARLVIESLGISLRTRDIILYSSHHPLSASRAFVPSAHRLTVVSMLANEDTPCSYYRASLKMRKLGSVDEFDRSVDGFRVG